MSYRYMVPPSLPRIRVDDGHLIGSGFDDVRVAVTDMAHVVDTIQIFVPSFAVHVLT